MTLKVGGKERTWAGILLWLVIAACFFPFIALAYFMMVGIIEVFYIAGQLPVAVGLVLNIGSILVFMFSLLAAPALFYFAKDVEYVLPLPLKPTQIIGAKFAIALAFEYLISLALVGTMFAALLRFVPADVLTFNGIITFLTLPILPVVYSTVLVMILMRVTRLGRNPDRYTLIVGILAIVLAVGFSLYAAEALTIDPEALMAALEGTPVFMTTMNTVFIGNGFAARAFGATRIFGGALHNQIINVAIVAGAVVVFFMLAKVLYFAGVIGLSESGAPAKKMTTADIASNTKGRGKFFAYFIKELRLLFRSPTAFINGVLGAFIMPIIMGISIVPLLRGGELQEFVDMINFSDTQVVAVVLAGLCAIGFLMGGLVTVTSTAISREGRNLFMMKYLPVSYITQFNAKAASGLIIAVPAVLAMLIPLGILFEAPVWIFIAGFLLTLPGLFSINYLGLYIDLMRPKLNWDNEQAAVKQNLNSLIVLGASWAIGVGVGLLGWFVFPSPVVAFLGLFGVTGLLAFGVYKLVMQSGQRLLEKLH